MQPGRLQMYGRNKLRELDIVTRAVNRASNQSTSNAAVAAATPTSAATTTPPGRAMALLAAVLRTCMGTGASFGPAAGRPAAETA